ncbi:GNAT family N-acetyltransferase [Spirochaeta cellobiosiphila]|uniref:GNAT family N-acetyltransferase n=1 Tax=Spirochaeta cellobiosiphila TaxID=504483 RepID=UPI00041435EB|nr:GNAT family N-acetyltransferase [Spirochaeta cellobiosiphila]
MKIEFRKPSDFKRGILFNLLEKAYSFDIRYKEHFLSNWQECDDFFYDNLTIADSCCIITCLEDKAIGFVCWDPRNIPEYVELGHNCIISEYKGLKYGKQQLQNAISRIFENTVKKIRVTTNRDLIAAQKNYESVGFNKIRVRENNTDTSFSGSYIDYEIICS